MNVLSVIAPTEKRFYPWRVIITLCAVSVSQSVMKARRSEKTFSVKNFAFGEIVLIFTESMKIKLRSRAMEVSHDVYR